MNGYLPRTFACLCGHDHALVDDRDVWYDQDDRVVGRTACLLAAGRITPEQAAEPEPTAVCDGCGEEAPNHGADCFTWGDDA